MQDLLFQLGPLAIYQWGAFLAAAYLIGIFYFWRLGRREGFASDSLLDLIFLSSFFGLLGGRLAFLLSFGGPLGVLEIIRVGEGVLWGGIFLAGAASAAVFVRFQGWSLTRIADSALTALALGQAVGYLGAELTGYFPFAFYPSLGFLLIWAIMRFLLVRGVASGYPAALYLTFAGGLLILAEWLRTVKAALESGLNLTYLFGGFLTGFGLLLLLFLVARRYLIKVKR